MQDPMNPQRPPDSDGKSIAFALAGMVGIALLAVLAIALMRGEKDPDQIAFADDASHSRIEKCNQYAAQVARDSGGTGGTGSVRDDDPNLVGVSDENRYSDAARVAYRDCMLGIQHDS